ncbi:hypothetical protein ACWFNS_10260 [Oerskovia enterophila]
MRSTILSRTFLGKKRFLASFDAFFEQGLLVVAEDGSKAVHETFEPTAGPVHHDGDSLYVVVQSAVDGPVTVVVFDAKAPRSLVDDLSLVFDGRFEGGIGRIVLEATDDSLRVVVAAEEDDSPRVRVYLDDLLWATVVVVVLS